MNTNEQDNMQKRELVRDLFLKLDKDGSGAVEAKEIALALNMYLVYYIYMLFCSQRELNIYLPKYIMYMYTHTHTHTHTHTLTHAHTSRRSRDG